MQIYLIDNQFIIYKLFKNYHINLVIFLAQLIKNILPLRHYKAICF